VFFQALTSSPTVHLGFITRPLFGLGEQGLIPYVWHGQITKEKNMKANLRMWAIGLGVLGPALMIAPSARAECGATFPKTIAGTNFLMSPGSIRLLPIAFQDANEQDEHAKWEPTIVGMWHVTFTAKTMNGIAISDMVIDSALVVWHIDGTEIMNSGRPPQDGNFCMGVWRQTGEFTYKLNHFAWGANNYTPGTPDGVVGDSIGPVHYVELVTVGPEGKRYSGTFTLDQYNKSGQVDTSFTGVINATRITVDTTVGDLL